jgi:siderophore synthetase component
MKDILNQKSWNFCNRQLVAKILAEFLYEEMLHTDIVDNVHYLRISNDLFYTFQADLRIFGNWRIDAASIMRHKQDEKTLDITVQQLIRDTYQMVGIDGLTLGHLLRELNHTLLADCHLYALKNLEAEALLQLKNHELESYMTGHPWFVINKGRLGFSYSDYMTYAPEMAKPTALAWIAVHRHIASFHAAKKISYDALLHEELSQKDLSAFQKVLIDLDLSINDYYFMPVHDWQWNMQIINLFTPEIVKQHIVYLGKSSDLYLPTQSIRTFCNDSHTHKLQVKLPLSIFNTAVFRGLPGERTRAAPLLTDWLLKKMQEDSYLQNECRLILLGEIASIDVPHPDYNQLECVPYQYKELLGVIWRENVNTYLKPTEKAITMASLIHVDSREKPFVSVLIAKSGLTMDAWLQALFQSVIPPLLHWLYQYGVVFSPHGENTLLILENNQPVGLVIKDFIDDVNISESQIPERKDLPESLQTILLSVPDDAITQFIYTGLFVVLYRYLSDILQTYENYPEKEFWKKVHNVILDYQNTHPALKPRFQQFNLLKRFFNKMCLNRLRLLSVGYKDYSDRPKVDTIRPMQNPLLKYLGE